MDNSLHIRKADQFMSRSSRLWFCLLMWYDSTVSENVASFNFISPLRWRQLGSPKCWYLMTTLCGVTSQKTVIWIFITLKTRSLASDQHCLGLQFWFVLLSVLEIGASDVLFLGHTGLPSLITSYYFSQMVGFFQHSCWKVRENIYSHF
jgi:hypothetical protein